MKISIIRTMTKMKIEYKVWVIYLTTILISVFVHELGHCIPAWIHGFRAIPTPAKEYISDTLPLDLKQHVSLGGIIGSILVSLAAITLYIKRTFIYNSAILAGAIALPGMYTLRFVLIGRGHDATEFQEAQSAIGLGYSGHSLDWIFLLLFISGITVWVLRSKPHYRIIGRLAIGFVLTLIFVIGLQEINNAIFDPIFQNN
jgi:hypothetical protein